MRRVRMWFVALLIPISLSAQLPASSLHLVQELRIDATEHNFEPIRELTVGPNGVITITQRGDGRVVLFASDGRLIAKVGRPGEGPGEFRYLHRIGWQGDRLWAHDMSLNRITLISTSGKIVRTLAIPSTIGAHPTSRQRPVGQWQIPTAFPDANTLVLSGGQGPAAQRAPWQRALGEGRMDIAIDSAGNFRHVVRMVPSPIRCTQRIQQMTVTIPQCPQTWDARSPNGKFLGVAMTESLGGSRFEVVVTLLTETGDTVYQRKHSFAGERMTTMQRDSIMDRVTSEASAPGLADALARVKLPQAFDPFRQLLVGDDGTVWLRERNRGGQAVWVSLDPSGVPAARVTLPVGARLMVPSRGQLWGLQADQDGVESIVRWRLVR